MKLLISLVAAGLLGASVPVQAAGDAEAGQAVYAARCRTCHGAEGEGNVALARNLQVEFRHLGSKEVQAKSDEELKDNITKGFGKKRPVTGLSEKQVDDVIAFLRTLAKEE